MRNKNYGTHNTGYDDEIPCPFEAVSMQKQLFIADAEASQDAVLPLTSEMIYIRITEQRTFKH